MNEAELAHLRLIQRGIRHHSDTRGVSPVVAALESRGLITRQHAGHAMWRLDLTKKGLAALTEADLNEE